MARLFTCGFEENDLTATMWTTVADTPTIVTSGTTAPRTGTYCLQIAGTATEYVARDLSASVTSGTYFTRVAIKKGANPGESVRIAWAGSTTTLGWHLNWKSDGAVELVASIPTTVVATTSALSNNTWYVLEVRHVIDNSAGELELRLDGVTVGSALTGIDTLPTTVGRWRLGQTGSALGGSFTFWMDDIAINDASGATFTTWCGLGKIVLVKPTADTATNQWTTSAGTDHYALVDDVPGTPDDATTYLQDGNTANVERFAVSDLPAEVGSSDTLVVLDVYGRGGVDVASTNTIVFRVWDEGGTSSDNGVNFNINNTSYRICSVGSSNEHFPYSLSGKTKANFADFNVGFKGATGTTNNKRVTAVWGNVEFIPSAGGGSPTPRMMLLGAG